MSIIYCGKEKPYILVWLLFGSTVFYCYLYLVIKTVIRTEFTLVLPLKFISVWWFLINIKLIEFRLKYIYDVYVCHFISVDQR